MNYASAPFSPPWLLPVERTDVLNTLVAALAERDAYTDGHCDRVSQLCLRLAQSCGMDKDALNELLVAARFHDIGKIGIPDTVLHKPGRLQEDEMAVMRTHSARGQRLFLATGHPGAERVAQLIRHHHEAWDGSGYPDCLTGGAIELGARILALVDGYDAMVTTRPYRAGMRHEDAMAILATEAGKRIDPDLYARFVEIMKDTALQPR